MEISEAAVTDRVNVISAQNRTAAYVRALDVSEEHQTDVFVIVEKIENPDIPLRDVRSSHVTSLRDSFCMYDFGYSRGTLSVNFHSAVSVDDVTTL